MTREAALEKALREARSALYEAATDYNHPNFTDRRGAGPRMTAALTAVNVALALTNDAPQEYMATAEDACSCTYTAEGDVLAPCHAHDLWLAAALDAAKGSK